MKRAGQVLTALAAAIVVAQFILGLFPLHAALTSGIIAALLGLQGWLPWHHRNWTEARLTGRKQLLESVNRYVFSVSCGIGVLVLVSAYAFQTAPHWIEERLRAEIHLNRIPPVSASVMMAVVSNVDKLPTTMVAAPESKASQSAGADPVLLPLSVFAAEPALAAAIGTTAWLSQYAAVGAFLQGILLFVMFLSERMAEDSPK